VTTALASGATATCINPGFDCVIVSGVTAAQTLAANIGLASTSTNPFFTVAPGPSGQGRTLNLHGTSLAVGTPPTTLKVSIYASPDNGLSWTLYQSEIALAATTAFTDFQAVNLVAGLMYQALATTLTLGSATSVGCIASVS
jgi:hypothetical protein